MLNVPLTPKKIKCHTRKFPYSVTFSIHSGSEIASLIKSILLFLAENGRSVCTNLFSVSFYVQFADSGIERKKYERKKENVSVVVTFWTFSNELHQRTNFLAVLAVSRVFHFIIFFSYEIDNNNFSLVGEWVSVCVCAVAAVRKDYTHMCTKNDMALVGALGCAQSTLPADSTHYIIFMPHFFSIH